MPYLRAVTAHNLPRRNIELKAVDVSPARSLAICRSLGAVDRGIIRQRDTYFTVSRRGLKLREEKPGCPHLIQFERVNEPEQRQSSYRIVRVDDAETLRAALGAAVGIDCVVEKERHLFLWRQVRIHLDDVKSLGRFIELEAVAAATSDLSDEYRLVGELRDAFAITDDRLRAIGYAEQLRASGSYGAAH